MNIPTEAQTERYRAVCNIIERVRVHLPVPGDSRFRTSYEARQAALKILTLCGDTNEYR
jgi:hypothetical protein